MVYNLTRILDTMKVGDELEAGVTTFSNTYIITKTEFGFNDSDGNEFEKAQDVVNNLITLYNEAQRAHKWIQEREYEEGIH
jgi:macrodomain Ter protein organizer (MatP/YcbG family)